MQTVSDEMSAASTLCAVASPGNLFSWIEARGLRTGRPRCFARGGRVGRLFSGGASRI
jgi:hypothetical protein